MSNNWKKEGAIVCIKWKEGAPRDAWKEWANESHMKWGWSTTGEWDCQVWVDAKNPAEVEEIVWNKLRKNQWVRDTKTWWAGLLWQSAA